VARSCEKLKQTEAYTRSKNRLAQVTFFRRFQLPEILFIYFQLFKIVSKRDISFKINMSCYVDLYDMVKLYCHTDESSLR
jgi:hypothetical protein